MKAYRYNGNVIRQPGVYVGVPIDAYHSGFLCEGLSVSSTGLRQVLKSPAHFWATHPLNPEKVEDDTERRHMAFGSACHCYALEPTLFSQQFQVLQPDAPKRPSVRQRQAKKPSEATLEAIAFWDQVEAQKKNVLSSQEFEDVTAMADVLRHDADAVKLFRDGMPELTFVARDEATGIWLLSRPDFVPAHPERGLVDYKTAANAEPSAFSRHAYDLGYDVQAAFALHVVELATGEKRDCFWFVVQEKTPPYVVQCARMQGDQIQFAKTKIRDALDRLNHCYQNDTWPAYRGAAFDIETPYYIRKLMEMQP